MTLSKTLVFLFFTALSLITLPTHGHAQNTLVFGMGAYDILDNEGSLALEIEYRRIWTIINIYSRTI
jgi:hypothetical protein